MDAADTPQTPADRPETRPDYWRRLLRAGVGKSPKAEVAVALTEAAEWSAYAVRLMNDPEVSPTAKVRATATARRARLDLAALKAASKPAELTPGEKFDAHIRRLAAEAAA
jgi:hypothetical protein